MIRSVDPSKCIGCGTCQRICPLDVFRLDVEQPKVSPCMAACPVGNDIRKINNLLALGRVNDAAALLLETNPLASVTGRLCAGYCESDCTRSGVDGAESIRAIEKYLGDYILSKEVKPFVRRHVAPIAVVGSGPAGLSCAYHLAADGFDVTVYEAMDEPGGMLRYVIPEQRLPYEILSSLIDRLGMMGVKIQCGRPLNDEFTVSDMLDQGYGAVFLGLGAARPKKISIAGVHADNVMYGLDFLRAVKMKQIKELGPAVVVIGGGDVAMDAAQTSLRLGARTVSVVALEDEKSMPAFLCNIENARADGIQLICSYGVDSIQCQGNAVKGIRIKRCVSIFKKECAFSPQFDDADIREIEANAVILAIGQETECNTLPSELVGDGGLIRVSLNSYQTPLPRVFAAGDVVTGTSSVAEAVYGGRRAAQAIQWFLQGIELENLPPRGMHEITEMPENMILTRVMKKGKKNEAETSGPRLNWSTKELDLVGTLAEADRCLLCGSKAYAAYRDDCMTCFSCELNCPAEAIFVHPFKEILPRSLRPI